MGKIAAILLFIVVASVLGGAIYLATADLPPPSHPVEKVIPDDRLGR